MGPVHWKGVGMIGGMFLALIFTVTAVVEHQQGDFPGFAIPAAICAAFAVYCMIHPNA